MHVTTVSTVEIDVSELNKELGRKTTVTDWKEVARATPEDQRRAWQTTATLAEIVQPVKRRRGIGSY